MCGIACYIGKRPLDRAACTAIEGLMKTRGPDARGQKSFKAGDYNIEFFHSRLAIIDIDHRSDQPFSFGPLTIIFNGEVYNYREIRAELTASGRTFATNSDTEVLLQAFEQWGEKAFEKCEGMWSCIIFNEQTGELTVSRDRFGEKPLFYLEAGGELIFASEVKYFQTLAPKKPGINLTKLRRFVALGHRTIHAEEETFFEGVLRFPAGHSAVYKPGLPLKPKSFWRPVFDDVSPASAADHVAMVKDRLKRAMELRLRADVPIAFCLSSGVDSSALCAYAARTLNAEVAAFSIIDPDPRYNEEDGIRRIVGHLGIKHSPIKLEKGNFLSKLRTLVNYHSAPLPTISYYVHALLSEEIARKGYKVVISGSGADELFTGYYEHFLAHLADTRADTNHARYLDEWRTHVASLVRNPALRNPELFYSPNPNSRHRYQGEAYRKFAETRNLIPPPEIQYSKSTLRNRLLNELFREIVPVILEADDLNSMRVSLENRSPFLDSDLFELCLKIPPAQMISGGFAKFILRSAVQDLLPDEIVWNRRKIGFNAAIDSLVDLRDPALRDFLLAASPLTEWVYKKDLEALLSKESLSDDENKFLFSCVSVTAFLAAFRAA